MRLLLYSDRKKWCHTDKLKCKWISHFSA